MSNLEKIFLHYNKFSLPKCWGKKCDCFRDGTVDLYFKNDAPLSYIVQLRATIKKYRIKYNQHYRAQCLTLNQNAHLVKGEVLLDCVRDHFETLNIFQDFVLTSSSKQNSLKGLCYISMLKVSLKKLSFIKKQMSTFIGLFNEIHSSHFYPKIQYDFYLTSHYHTAVVFQKYILYIEKTENLLLS